MNLSLILIHQDVPLEGLGRQVPGAPPDLYLREAAHDVVGDEDVVELLADHPEQPVQIHVEVVQVPLVRAGVVVLLKEGVGQLRDDGVLGEDLHERGVGKQPITQ